METLTHTIKETTWPAKTFITKRATLPFDKLSSFFGSSYGALYGAAGKQGLKAAEAPCAIYYSIDEEKQVTEFAAAVPVQGNVPDSAEYEKVSLPASKVITTTHTGPYETMRTTYDAMEKYLKDHKLKRELVIEEYLSDPEVEKDSSKWKTNIYFVVK